MSYSDPLFLANVAVYSTLALGVIVRLAYGGNLASEGLSAFETVYEESRARFPEIPAGSTLREVLLRVRSNAPEVDWEVLEVELSAYEAHKYGAGPRPTSQNEAGRLARAIRRRWP